MKVKVAVIIKTVDTLIRIRGKKNSNLNVLYKIPLTVCLFRNRVHRMYCIIVSLDVRLKLECLFLKLKFYIQYQILYMYRSIY